MVVLKVTVSLQQKPFTFCRPALRIANFNKTTSTRKTATSATLRNGQPYKLANTRTYNGTYNGTNNGTHTRKYQLRRGKHHGSPKLASLHPLPISPLPLPFPNLLTPFPPPNA